MIFEIIKWVIILFVLTDLGHFISDLMQTINKPVNKLLGVISLIMTYVLSCAKCTSFWFTLIATGDLLVAAIVALLVNWLKAIEYKYKKTDL